MVKKKADVHVFVVQQHNLSVGEFVVGYLEVVVEESNESGWWIQKGLQILIKS